MTDTTTETVGARLFRLRKERGLSQRTLCKETNYSYAYVSRIESGERNPSVRALRDFARRLNVDPYYLEHGTQDPQRERAWSVLEIAKFWRARCRFLERRLDALEARATADPTTLEGDVLSEVQRLSMLVNGEVARIE